ncbi:MAG: trypco2 family protein, partial [Candidatus Brocadiales bacterium]|nr:trypco2 family protein [Candidatus Brocadiales bacterium]
MEMKIWLHSCLISLVIYISISNVAAEEAKNVALNLNELILALKNQIILLKKELKDDKEKAGIKLKECKVEIKYVLKQDASGKLSAWVVEAGAGYGTEETHTFATTWEPVEDIIAEHKKPLLKKTQGQVTALEAEIKEDTKEMASCPTCGGKVSAVKK